MKCLRVYVTWKLTSYLPQFHRCWQKDRDSLVSERTLLFIIIAIIILLYLFLLFIPQQMAWDSHFHWFLLTPKLQRENVEAGPAGCYALHGVLHTWVTLSLGTQYFKTRLLANLSNHCPEGDITLIVLVRSRHSASDGDTTLTSKAVCSTNIQAKMFQNKAVDAFCSEDRQKCRAVMKNCFQISLLDQYLPGYILLMLKGMCMSASIPLGEVSHPKWKREEFHY